MLESVLLGALQGITEWLPVSSEGVVAVVYTALFDRPVSEAVAYALWLHLGTALSAAVAFRADIGRLLTDLVSLPKRPSKLFTFLVIASAVSGVVGLPLLLTLEEVSRYLGASAMAVVGLAMMVTGGLQLLRPSRGARGADAASGIDAVVAGVAQGLAAVPGLSRSGLTVASLLARHIDRQDALTLSFLMSIPASVGASAFVVATDGVVVGPEEVVSSLVAFLVGLLTIRWLVRVAARVNFGPFVIAVGALTMVGALVQAVGT